MELSNRTRRLLKDVDTGPVRRGIVVRYGAGLAGIALLSIVGSSGKDAAQLPGHAMLAATHPGRPTPEHRRQVFEERRDRFTHSVDRHAIPVNTVKPVNRAMAILIQ